MRGRTWFFGWMVAALVLAGACKREQPAPGDTGAEQALGGPAAVATLEGAPGTDVSGTVRFYQGNGDEIHVVAEVSGASPGAHGIHIHETGACVPPGFESAGAHFNPTGAPHGCPPDPNRHLGDFGNIQIGKDGTGRLDLATPLLSLSGSSSIIGKAVIFHRRTDDCTSQPAGKSGARIACGIIRETK